MTLKDSKRRTLFYLMLSMLFGSCMSVCLTPYVLTQFNYQTVRDGSCPAFAFIYWVQNLAATGVLLASAKLTSFLASANETLRLALWPGFHYIQLLLVVTLVVSAGAFCWLRRCLATESSETMGGIAPCASGRPVPVAG